MFELAIDLVFERKLGRANFDERLMKIDSTNVFGYPIPNADFAIRRNDILEIIRYDGLIIYPPNHNEQKYLQ